MAADWKTRLGQLLKSMENSRANKTSLVVERSSAAPLAINLGIDFGTSFTKVAYRDVGTERTGIVTFGGENLDAVMIPSVVTIAGDGALSLKSTIHRDGNLTDVRYLKMRLDDLCRSAGSSALHDSLPSVCGIDLNKKKSICAMSSWFLATVIVEAKHWVMEKERDLALGRKLQWSSNVGVPVAYCDSPSIDVFREVLAVAWNWANANDVPARLEDAIVRYEATTPVLELEKTNCHAIPEIGAAVQSFLTSREAVPGLYVYFDIGGGTVDGVVINYINWNGDRHINFLSGKVVPLGVSQIAARVKGDGQDVEQALATGTIDSSLGSQLNEIRPEVRSLVGSVIMKAKSRDGRDWQKEHVQGGSHIRNVSNRRDIAGMAPLRIFLGGGGAGSKWYQQTILSTYKENNHDNAGIPPYELAEVPKPADLDIGRLREMDFRRYVVAHGLSVPFREGLEINLPSEFSEVGPLPPRNDANVVEYSNSKDVYD